MSRYRLELATPADDADLRAILAHTPMAGPIAVSFRREPSYFDAAVVDGSFRQVVAARDLETGRLVGFGSRAVRDVYVNGRPASVGYLSSLRLLEEHRNRGLVARGYARFRRLHADGRAALYLTTIAEGNERAMDLLTSGRAGLPAYHDAGVYHTLTIPRRRNGWAPGAKLEVRPATTTDLSTIVAFLAREGPRRQFFPQVAERDLFNPEGAYRGLMPQDLLLAFRDGSLVGTLGVWDQRAFRQTVVEGYHGPVQWARPLMNGLASLRGGPRLPPPGAPLRAVYAALPVVVNDDPDVFAALLDAALAHAAETGDYLMLGLHAADPHLSVARRYPATEYATRVYVVCWEDGEPLRATLDGRPPYLELGSL